MLVVSPSVPRRFVYRRVFALSVLVTTLAVRIAFPWVSIAHAAHPVSFPWFPTLASSTLVGRSLINLSLSWRLTDIDNFVIFCVESAIDYFGPICHVFLPSVCGVRLFVDADCCHLGPQGVPDGGRLRPLLIHGLSKK
ncbi:hypothetical protein R1flu_003342 [Riccia fluitans]|uniref:Secreted protein n=1 Tax=Riccia fluitans TaxID=41844 RepID=A0ABD1YBU0_9MARC